MVTLITIAGSTVRLRRDRSKFPTLSRQVRAYEREAGVRVKFATAS